MFLPKKKKPLFDFDEVSPINKVLFPAPSPFYEENSFPGELCWIGDPPSPCLVLPVPGGARYLLIYMHGNAEDIGCSRPLMMALRFSLQCHIIAVEYPGYGCFPGRPNEANVNDALNRVVTYCVNVLKFDQKNIILFGRSIGTGPCTKIAVNGDFRALILLSPYTSIRAVVKHLMGAAAQYLISDRFKSDEEIQNVHCPVLIIHGRLDRLIPWTQAETLYNLCPSIMKRLAVSETMDHNNFDLEDDVVQPVQMFLCSMDERGAGPPRDLAIEKARFTCPPEMRSQRSQSATPGASGSAGGSGAAGAPRERPSRPAESLAGRRGGVRPGSAPPGPRAPPRPPTVDPGAYAEQLAMLREMGFVDERAALRAVHRAGGDLETAVELLSASFLDAVQIEEAARRWSGGDAPGGPAAARARGSDPGAAAAAAAGGGGGGRGGGGLGAGRRAADVRGEEGKYNAAVSTMREMGFQEAEEVLVQALKSARGSVERAVAFLFRGGRPARPPRPARPLSSSDRGQPDARAAGGERARPARREADPGGPRGGGGAGGAACWGPGGGGRGLVLPWVDAAESPDTPELRAYRFRPDSDGEASPPRRKGEGEGAEGSAPEAAGAPEEADYGAQLAAMAEMGFGDAPRALAALRAAGGDVDRAVSALLASPE
eukprot:tig00001335_g8217.t1